MRVSAEVGFRDLNYRPPVLIPGWIRYLHVLSPARNRFPRYTSSATPANLLANNMAAEPFSSTYLHKVNRHSIFSQFRKSDRADIFASVVYICLCVNIMV